MKRIPFTTIGLFAALVWVAPSLAQQASEAKRPRTPHGKFAVYRDVCETIRSTDMVAVNASRASVDRAHAIHPFSEMIARSLANDEMFGDTLTLKSVTDNVVPLTWELTPNFTRDTSEWLEDAQKLAVGYYRLGMTDEAIQWLKLLDAKSPYRVTKVMVRRMLTGHYAAYNDSAGVEWLVQTWRRTYTEGDDGRAASVALLSALYYRDRWDLLEKMTNKYPTLVVYADWFRAFKLYNEGDIAGAKEHISRALWWMHDDVTHRYSVSMKLAALILDADLDWRVDMDGLATRKYVLLSQIDHPYVKSWSEFMLGSIAMHNLEYEIAVDRFRKLCESRDDSIWKNVACGLREHSQKMSEAFASGYGEVDDIDS